MFNKRDHLLNRLSFLVILDLSIRISSTAYPESGCGAPDRPAKRRRVHLHWFIPRDSGRFGGGVVSKL